ncbi:YcxB family protein [Gorillibacterium massiliense]|uniref:YcxB family protein n=1 Tax=Gorillibacterium massiliense TaxID=1280390 RepID=UPI003B500BEB
MESASTNQKINWADIKKYVITKNGLSLFVSANSAHLIPLASMSNADRDTLIRLVVSKVPQQKRNVLPSIFFYLLIFLVVIGIIQFMSK